MKGYLSFYKDLPKDVKKITLFIFFTYFLVLFSYPFVRASASAIFYEAYSPNEYSFATFISIVALMGLVYLNNYLQPKVGVHNIYFFSGLLTIAMLAIGFVGYKFEIKQMAYVIFATKESYIVLLVHTCLAFANSYYSLDQFKRLISFVGASGSLGGVLGGQLTKHIATSYGTDTVFMLSLFIILATVLIFYLTKSAKIKDQVVDHKDTPIQAIESVKKYVFLIAGVVTLSQFVIYIADLQFNIIFENTIKLKDERTAYLGNLYSYINGVGLFLQFVIIPYLLIMIRPRNVFLSIPLIYLLLVLGGVSIGGGTLFTMSLVFMMMKGVDYSVFAAVKEVMYHPLTNSQKYGAKYITDMFIYRVSKAFMAIIMAQFLVGQILDYLNLLQIFFIALWVVAIILLFKEQNKLK